MKKERKNIHSISLRQEAVCANSSKNATSILFRNGFLKGAGEGRWRHFVFGRQFSAQVHRHELANFLNGQILTS